MKYKGEGFGLGHSVANDGKRHVSPSSKRHYDAKELKREVLAKGGTWYGGKDWDNQQIDTLLDSFFLCYHNSRKVGGKRKLALGCGRTFDAIGTKLRKLGIRYKERGDTTHLYIPVKRTQRTGVAWVNADLAFIELATGPEGITNGAPAPLWLSNLLARDANEIHSKMKRMSDRPAGWFNEYHEKSEILSPTDLKRIHQACNGTWVGLLG